MYRHSGASFLFRLLFSLLYILLSLLFFLLLPLYLLFFLLLLLPLLLFLVLLLYLLLFLLLPLYLLLFLLLLLFLPEHFYLGSLPSRNIIIISLVRLKSSGCSVTSSLLTQTASLSSVRSIRICVSPSTSQ